MSGGISIRDAKVEDIPRLMELAVEATRKSAYAHAPLDHGAVRRSMLYCISSNAQFMRVIEVNGNIEGMLAATVEKIWYSTKKAASELFFYTTEAGSGGAGLLARSFVRWARKRPGVVSIALSVPQQDRRAKRVGKTLGKIGLQFTVATYEEVRDVQEADQRYQEGNQVHRSGNQEGIQEPAG